MTIYISPRVLFDGFSHALLTDREEIAGVLLGEFQPSGDVVVRFARALPRADRSSDRVELSATDLAKAAVAAETMSASVRRPVAVVGWYHSHPRITYLPSEVDLSTQSQYQHLNPLWIGLIFAVFHSTDTNALDDAYGDAVHTPAGNGRLCRQRLQLHAFRTGPGGSHLHVPMRVLRTTFAPCFGLVDSVILTGSSGTCCTVLAPTGVAGASAGSPKAAGPVVCIDGSFQATSGVGEWPAQSSTYPAVFCPPAWAGVPTSASTFPSQFGLPYDSALCRWQTPGSVSCSRESTEIGTAPSAQSASVGSSFGPLISAATATNAISAASEDGSCASPIVNRFLVAMQDLQTAPLPETAQAPATQEGNDAFVPCGAPPCIYSDCAYLFQMLVQEEISNYVAALGLSDVLGDDVEDSEFSAAHALVAALKQRANTEESAMTCNHPSCCTAIHHHNGVLARHLARVTGGYAEPLRTCLTSMLKHAKGHLHHRKAYLASLSQSTECIPDPDPGLGQTADAALSFSAMAVSSQDVPTDPDPASPPDFVPCASIESESLGNVIGAALQSSPSIRRITM